MAKSKSKSKNRRRKNRYWRPFLDSRQDMGINNSYDFWVKALNCVEKRKKDALL